MGASIGGMQAFQRICAALPADLPAAVFIVWHTALHSPGILPDVLNRSARLPVAFARDGEAIEHGRVYVAPPDHHMLLWRDVVQLNRGPRQNRFRPAVDPLFHSAADAFGPRVVGVIMTGGLDDGTAGLMHVKRERGVAVVQDPLDADEPGMPRSALEMVDADFVLPIAQIPEVLVRLATEQPQPPIRLEEAKAQMYNSDKDIGQGLRPEGVTGPPAEVTCPDCSGALWRETEDGVVKYRCHVGHSFTEQGLLAAKNEEVELALWTALRVLKENATMYRNIIERSTAAGRLASAEHFKQSLEQTEYELQVIKKALMTDSPGRAIRGERKSAPD
ncbi:MAG TPA: chemotaxis protein CheB [Tepidisphaeraceae bacterium]|nr:chemotaxis protein CheB [Tepidisphaeraceae bacterium]